MTEVHAWRRYGFELSKPATVTMTAAPPTAAARTPPRLQACAARGPDGQPAVHLGLFNIPARQWADGLATTAEAVDAAAAILAAVAAAEERWGERW